MVLAGGRSLNLWSSLDSETRRSSRLYRALVDDGGAAEIGTGLLPTAQPFLYTVSATVRAGGSIEAVETEVRDTLGHLAAAPPSDEEMERARTQLRSRLVFDSDSVTDLAVGAGGDDDGGVNAGAVWILFMNTDGTVASEQKISNTAGGFGGVLDSGDNFGRDVANIGDLDGDGVTDLAVGCRSRFPPRRMSVLFRSPFLITRTT